MGSHVLRANECAKMFVSFLNFICRRTRSKNYEALHEISPSKHGLFLPSVIVCMRFS